MLYTDSTLNAKCYLIFLVTSPAKTRRQENALNFSKKLDRFHASEKWYDVHLCCSCGQDNISKQVNWNPSQETLYKKFDGAFKSCDIKCGSKPHQRLSGIMRTEITLWVLISHDYSWACVLFQVFAIGPSAGLRPLYLVLLDLEKAFVRMPHKLIEFVVRQHLELEEFVRLFYRDSTSKIRGMTGKSKRCS